MSVLSPNYGVLKDAAHKKPTTICTHKAITRQWSYWPESSNFESGSANSLIDPGKGINGLNAVVLEELNYERELLDIAAKKIFENQGIQNIFASRSLQVPHEPWGSESRYRIVSGYDHAGFFNRIVVSRHYNRVTLKHIIDRDYTSKDIGEPPEKKDIRLLRAFDSVDRILTNYKECLPKPRDEGYITEASEDYQRIQEFWRKNFDELRSDLQYLHAGHWEALEEEIGTDSIISEINQDKKWRAKLRKFADLRGVVWPASERIPPQIEGDLNEQNLESDYLLLRQNWALIKASEYDPSTVKVGKGTQYFSASDIVASGVGKVSSNLNNNTGIYVSTVGQEIVPSKTVEARNSAPIRFFVLAKTKNDRQIGRLIDKIELLGIYRLTALRDYLKVREAGRQLQVIEESLDRASVEDLSAPSFVNDFGEVLRRVGRDIEGGLPYRIAVGKHYADSLKRLVSAMAFSKINGFESYDDFVSRKLYQIYDYNDLVGERLERLQRKRANFLMRAQISTIEATATEIRKATENGNRIAEVGHAIEIVAVTYYVGQIAEKALKAADVDISAIGIYPTVLVLWALARRRVTNFLIGDREHGISRTGIFIMLCGLVVAWTASLLI